jgi:hypothetical protein
VTIDGNIDPAEWNTADSATAMLLAQDVGGNPAPTTRQSRAWLTYDETALYIAVDSAIHPDTKLDGNQWGANDAVEIAVRTVRQGKTSPIAVVRGYGNGFLQFGTATSGADDPKSMEPAGTVFKTTRPEPGRWTAEFRIPFAMLDMDPAADTKAAFSLTVRKSHDNLWLMWEGTRAHSYDVSQAGFIELLR